MYAIPVMLLVYLVGAQMWSMTWNAQYAHVKARYDLHQQANHRPCTDGQNKISGQISSNAQATTIKNSFYGDRYMREAGNARTMKAKYTIVCK